MTSEESKWTEEVFFGIHTDQHATAEDTVLGAGLSYEHLYDALTKIQPDWVQCDCKGHPGYCSWPTEVGSASPGIVRDSLRIYRDVTRDLGIPLVMHYSGVWDNRAIELHPDWATVTSSGETTGKEGFVTGGTCTLSPYVTDLMIPHMHEIIEKYDVDGFWVDGENWAVKPCYCPRCITAFQAETGLTEAPQDASDPHWSLWAIFHRRNFEAYVSRYVNAVHAKKPSCLVCSNWMYTVSQPEEIRAPVDFLSGDFAWIWGSRSAALEARFMDSRGLPWNLLAWGFTTAENGMHGWTIKPVAQLCQEAASTISVGGPIAIYITPQRDGYLPTWITDNLAEVSRFVQARKPWCQHTTSVPQVAVLHASSHLYAELHDALMLGHPNKPVLGALHALLENHCHVDILSEEALRQRIHQYPLVVIPEQTRLPDPLKATIADYVRAGGKVILSGAHVATDFAELAGVQASGEVEEGYFHVQVGCEATTLKGPWQPVKLNGATTMRYLMSGYEPGRDETSIPAITLHQYGAGQVLAVHSGIFAFFASSFYPRTRRLVGELISSLHPDFLIELDAPAYVHLSLRRQPGRLIAHLSNQSTAYPTSDAQVIIEEVPPTGPITLRAALPKKPRAVYLAPSMTGLSWEWQQGLLTVHVTAIGILDSIVIEE